MSQERRGEALVSDSVNINDSSDFMLDMNKSDETHSSDLIDNTVTDEG